MTRVTIYAKKLQTNARYDLAVWGGGQKPRAGRPDYPFIFSNRDTLSRLPRRARRILAHYDLICSHTSQLFPLPPPGLGGGDSVGRANDAVEMPDGFGGDTNTFVVESVDKSKRVEEPAPPVVDAPNFSQTCRHVSRSEFNTRRASSNFC